MHSHLTPKQVARAVGVSEASLKRWCDKGLIPTVRTAGGHRRLPLADVIAFIRTTGHALVRPEVLGLPAASGHGETVLDRAREQFRATLESGDDESVRRIGFDLYLAGHSALTLCDKVLAHTFHALGERWQHGEIEVYQERRACDICLRFLHELRALLAAPADNAALAIVSTPDGDPYALPGTMVDLVLREAGWRSAFYGSGNPFASLRAALRDARPRLFCLSVSTVPVDAELFLKEYGELYAEATSLGVAIAVGGRGLTPQLREHMRYANFSESLEKLVGFAAALQPQQARPEDARVISET
jgi:MerR family transcriptional regulator, light-induced transcriptional regulator